MKIPSNMTESEVVDTINKVIDRVAHKFTFSHYDIEDIKQEAFMIAMDALPRYDEVRPLENFLAVHVSNRLKNFKRDHYYRQESIERHLNREGEYKPSIERRIKDHISKKHLMEPINLEYVKDEGEKNMSVEHDFIEEMEIKELISLVDEHLPANMRSDYLKILHDVYVPKQRREEIYETLRTIFKDCGYA